jgi:cytochrome c oxidase assembly protein subunit 15
MTDSPTSPGFPSPRLLRRWAAGTLALLFVLLTLGTVVTSFRVGMADPVWPTRPWHLLTITWEEPNPGYLIEHTHRLAGFVSGVAVALLACLVWLTERRPVLRWGGLLAIVALVAAFMGHLHGSLLAHQKVLKETGELSQPNWLATFSPTLIALAVTLILGVWSAATDVSGGRRLLAIVFLVGMMTQGILGGLRVYFNALIGPDLAAVHGVFSQIVVALAVTLTVLCVPRRGGPADDHWHPDAALVRGSLIAVAAVFAQIVAGAVLRHTASPLGPRLHILGAFLVVFIIAAVSRRSRGTPGGVRGLAVLAASLAGFQVLLGVEAWMARFKAGIVLSPMQPITVSDTVIRTLHALTGYGLFATTVALAVVLLRSRDTTPANTPARRPAAPVEALV